MNKLYSILVFFAVSFTSCLNKNSHAPQSDFTINYDNGKLWKDCKYESQLDSEHYIYNCKLYYKEGAIMEEGQFMNDSIPVGWHTHYRQSGSVKFKKEWFVISENRIAMNQVLKFDKNGKIDQDGSNYFEISRTDSTDDEHVIEFNLVAPYFKSSRMFVHLESNADSSDQTLSSNSLNVSYSFNVKNLSTLKIKGYIEEMQELTRSGDSAQYQKRDLYFEKEFQVK